MSLAENFYAVYRSSLGLQVKGLCDFGLLGLRLYRPRDQVMASSAEYQKFAAPSDREEDDKKSKNKLRLFAVSVLAFIVITVAALVIGISVGVSRSQTNCLTIISASPGELQGKYMTASLEEFIFILQWMTLSSIFPSPQPVEQQSYTCYTPSSHPWRWWVRTRHTFW